MSDCKLYNQWAYLWPRLSPPEDYHAEAEHLRQLLKQQLGKKKFEHHRPTLMELGAGGGHSLYHLKDEFDAVAVDISPQMLEQCKKLNPTITCHVGDMRNLALGLQFDAILIHDAIDYMQTPDEAVACLKTASEHLLPRGVIIIAPTYLQETFENHQTAFDELSNDQYELLYVAHVYQPNNLTNKYELCLQWMLKENDLLKMETDRHQCGLFTSCQWIDWLNEAGFEDIQTPNDDVPWHPFIAKKSSLS